MYCIVKQDQSCQHNCCNTTGNKYQLNLTITCEECTVKRFDAVVRHPNLVTQDQFTQVLKKVSDIPEENFTINIELF
jgi:hypothetical protein